MLNLNSKIAVFVLFSRGWPGSLETMYALRIAQFSKTCARAGAHQTLSEFLVLMSKAERFEACHQSDTPPCIAAIKTLQARVLPDRFFASAGLRSRVFWACGLGGRRSQFFPSYIFGTERWLSG
ncbi:protein of unknown function [Candidatus Filomicrobium marinum]|uniref:Uncharacterized protein n=1 Tax=Candidatus Filomicrobium marinum TaxID=1608628 RepID=A0A0D6JE32_9HYPH|nr:protein of unknown function [Candidatus Filomicrobium marinum]CPR17730.1 protein of unknown function [Candidatus Filomicrobium marinum]